MYPANRFVMKTPVYMLIHENEWIFLFLICNDVTKEIGILNCFLQKIFTVSEEPHF